MSLEKRIADLEKEVAELKEQVSTQPNVIIKLVEEKVLKALQSANQQFS